MPLAGKIIQIMTRKEALLNQSLDGSITQDLNHKKLGELNYEQSKFEHFLTNLNTSLWNVENHVRL